MKNIEKKLDFEELEERLEMEGGSCERKCSGGDGGDGGDNGGGSGGDGGGSSSEIEVGR